MMALTADHQAEGRGLLRRVRAGAALLAALCSLGVGCGRRAAPGREEVVVYCSVDQQFARGILTEFERRSAVRVRARYDEEARKTTGLVQRLRAERAAPAADVFWSSEIFQTIRLAAEGLLAPYHGPGAADRPRRYADPNGLWHAFGLRMRVIAFDTRRVRPEQAPRRLEDLLAERWKGRLVMAQPQFGTTRGDLAAWFAHYGPGKARAILDGLKANGVRLVQGNSMAVRAVARGAADVCFTDTDDVHVARRNGWPVGMVPLDLGGAGALAIPNTVALVRGGPNPAAGRKLVAWLLSEAVERALAESDSHNTPVRPELARRFARYAPGRALAVDYAAVARQMPAAMAAAREVFR